MSTKPTTNCLPKVSVVIPCHNHALFLEEAVQSVLNSNYHDYEIIIMDDGSKDNSMAVAKQLQDRHPAHVRALHQDNAGPSVARNKGIEVADGKYILCLDADDKISVDYLSQAVSAMDENEDFKLVYCEAEKFGLKNCKWNLKPFSPESLALDNMIFVSAMFRKTDWSEVNGFEPTMTWGWEDWEFWINMMKSGGKVHKLPTVGFYYRIHQCSRRKSVNKSAKQLTIDLINRKHISFLRKHIGGPLRNPRSWSKEINSLENKVYGLFNQKTESRFFSVSERK